jgi:hypothetical protein
MTEAEAREIVERYEALVAAAHRTASRPMGYFQMPLTLERAGGITYVVCEKLEEPSPTHYVRVAVEEIVFSS